MCLQLNLERDAALHLLPYNVLQECAVATIVQPLYCNMQFAWTTMHTSDATCSSSVDEEIRQPLAMRLPPKKAVSVAYPLSNCIYFQRYFRCHFSTAFCVRYFLQVKWRGCLVSSLDSICTMPANLNPYFKVRIQVCYRFTGSSFADRASQQYMQTLTWVNLRSSGDSER